MINVNSNGVNSSDVNKDNQLRKQLVEILDRVSAVEDPWRPVFHLSPPVGLLNDPNGLAFYGGRYHMFYQWNPLACAHGAKYWGHVSSSNLIDWQHHPVALTPAEDYESHGCYSGSAVVVNGVVNGVVNDDRLMFFYTGNVKKNDDSRESWQCLAELVVGGDKVIKSGPLFGIPEGYTRHVRDPKVWRQSDGRWAMVLGAQTLSTQTGDEQGKVLLYRSDDLHRWALVGELTGSHHQGLGDFGYMWECPDLFTLQGHDVLMACPQGLAAEGERYRNVYQCGYFTGHFDEQAGTFSHGEFTELDHGFEFYAPQTFEDDKGRRLLVGWMGVPEQDELSQPTIPYGWLHMMTLPRELVMVNGRLQQRVPVELMMLRKTMLLDGRFSGEQHISAACECLLNVRNRPFTLNWRDSAELSWDGERFLFTRLNWSSGLWEERVVRPEQVDTVRIFHDHSSLEVFINGGETVMTGRLFPKTKCLKGESLIIDLQIAEPLSMKVWELRSGFPDPMSAARDAT